MKKLTKKESKKIYNEVKKIFKWTFFPLFIIAVFTISKGLFLWSIRYLEAFGIFFVSWHIADAINMAREM